MIHLITYANDKCANAKTRLCNEAVATNWFDTITAYGEEDLDSDFNADFNNILQCSRGGGYWIWKPYIIKKRLYQIKDNDILIYLDAGCTINPYGKSKLIEYIEMLNQSDVGIFSFQMEHIEKSWTIKEIFQHFNIDPDGEIANSGQNIATIQIIKKNANSIKLVNLWNETLYANPILFTDHYNNTQESYFKDNRHDQSIFSVIKKMHNTITLPDQTFFVPFGNAESLEFPFWATRFR
jgi:hypothetical protein